MTNYILRDLGSENCNKAVLEGSREISDIGVVYDPYGEGFLTNEFGLRPVCRIGQLKYKGF